MRGTYARVPAPLQSDDDLVDHRVEAGAAGPYRSALAEGDEIRVLAGRKLDMRVLAVGGGSGDFRPGTMRQVATDITAVSLDGIGHYVAMEAPERPSP